MKLWAIIVLFLGITWSAKELNPNELIPEFMSQGISYESSVDHIAPLLAIVKFQRTGQPKPLMVVVHGYGSSKMDVSDDCTSASYKGYFALGMDMRGRGGSAGEYDSAGLSTMDIYDAIVAAKENYPQEIDIERIHILGFSGGGGETLAAVSRFPNLFVSAAVFFGVSDFGSWYEGIVDERLRYFVEMALIPGFMSDPEKYAARDFILAAGNSCSTRMYFFSDEDETICSPAMIEKYVAARQVCGAGSTEMNISRRSDADRWLHGYRALIPAVGKAVDKYFDQALNLSKSLSAVDVSYHVPGYLVAPDFEVWLGQTIAGTATVVQTNSEIEITQVKSDQVFISSSRRQF